LSIIFNRFSFIPVILTTSYIFLYSQVASQHLFEKETASNRVQSVINRLQEQIDNRKRKIFSQKISETDKKILLYPSDNQDIEVDEDKFYYMYLNQMNDLDFRTKNIIYANTYFLKYEILAKPEIYDIVAVLYKFYNKKNKYCIYDTNEQLQKLIDMNIKEIFNINFYGTTFTHFNFSVCWLMYNNFEKCDLRFSIFCEARLHFVNFKECILWNCCFNDAEVNGTCFFQSELFGAKLDKITCTQQPPSSVGCPQSILEHNNQQLPSFDGAYYNKYPFYCTNFDEKEKLMSVNKDIDGDKFIIVNATIFPENFDPKEHGMIQCECVSNCIYNDNNKEYKCQFQFIAIENEEDKKVFSKFIDEKKKNNEPIIYVKYDNKIKCFIFDHELLKEKYENWYI
jgi:hypothetical protein